MKLKLTQTLLTCSVLGLSACGGPLPEEQGVLPSKEVGHMAQLLRKPRSVPDEYIVVLREDVKDVALRGSSDVAREMVSARGGQVLHTYERALRGFWVKMPISQVRELLADPRVAYVEENGIVSVSGTQTGATWGIDRIDQASLPLNSTYNYNVDGTGVHAYIIDTGMRLTHSQFTGRVGNGFDSITSGGTASDCHGHGTHVAGTVGGTTWGVAKKVTLHPVRVLDCTGYGSDAQVIAGLDWVTANHVKPAVANMSLGGDASQALDDAVERTIAAGVVVAVAAGNDSSSACNYSPARTPNAITVGSTTSSDARSSFSNYGTCLDIFGPGSSITSASYSSDTSSTSMSGTSMASPHVAGAAALYLSANPSATPAQVTAALTTNATPNKVTSPGTGSPNKLLYTGFITGGGGGGDTTAPSTSITAPAGGSTLSGTTTVSADASDNVGVSKVEFYAGSSLIGTDSTTPYSVDWNTTAVANGSYSLTTKAYDAAGNVGTSSTVSVTVNNATGSCSTTEQLLANAGFESGNVSWTASTSVIDGTTSGSAARTGSYKAWLDGYGSSHTDTIYQQVTIPSTACSASFSFWVKVTTSETEAVAYDTLTVQVQNSSGTALATLATYSNLDASTGYVQKSFDLSAYKGQTIRVYFKGVEDASLKTSFFLDDAAVSITR
ncbi:S8 family serine peptidase [Vitiosangium sp. GDMCC 1.1324]|uniref:S8 family serine peptidase n=1 Tax=Vitiosangium sp. (strain GDMCC 1.1324) TaxID=2138576 RepID=UPI000D3A1AB2|nr:S8 family serine peptidase [Vitiosangium sp. GDMCC 1.1324]PTL78734.1 serine protease [Vitiosangium sp. GDMCC 1.1324]